jgi:hypothetical protein
VPLTIVADFHAQPENVRRGAQSLFEAWHETLLRSVEAMEKVLHERQGRSPKTWRAGHAILLAIAPVQSALCSAKYLFIDLPPTADREPWLEQLRKTIAEKLGAFDAGPLLDELNAAVVQECAAQQGSPSQLAPPQMGFGPRQEELPAAVPAIDEESQAIALLFTHSEWTIAQIAQHLGKDRTTLYDWPKFRAAAELKGLLKPRGPKTAAPRHGHKTRDGSVEAYSDKVEGE